MPIPAIRTQIDQLDLEYSIMTALDCSDLPDMARQEFKDETDVNKILQRYGIDGMLRKPEYGEVDYNMDLQQSIDAIRDAERAIAKLPPELREKYGTWEKLFAGAYNGGVQTDLVAYFEKQQSDKAAADAAAVRSATPTP